ncbi:MAG TPA: phage portal protein [Methanothrix sp.]|nr:phage portal protein [Methanothrix sp.]
MTLTDFSFLESGRRFPPTDEKARIDRYDRCTLLFEGDHEAAFPGLTALDDDLDMIGANWFKRSTTLISDLASPARFFADNQDTLDRILEATDFDLLVYDLFGDVLKFGNGVLKVRFDPRRGGIIERVDPRYWFPVVSPDDSKNVLAHCICYNFSQYEDHIERGYLRVEIHKPGSITNRLFRLDSGAVITSEIPISAIERYSGMQSEVSTGVPDFLIVPVAGLLASDGVFGLDDFAGIEGLVRELEKRMIRTSRTLDKFSDPNILWPRAADDYIDPATGEEIEPVEIEIGGGRYIVYPIGTGDPNSGGFVPHLPSYLTWDASLQNNFAQIEEIKSQLMAMGEISPSLLGDVKNGIAESGSALKRLAIPTLAKVSRLRARVKRPLLHALRLCAELETVSRYPGASGLPNITVEWRSSLPEDRLEGAQIEQLRKTAGLTSTRSALARLDPDSSDEDLDWEESKISEERRDESYQFV